MKIREHLAARLGFIVAHLFAGALCIAVIQLDLLSTGGLGLTRGSSTYIALLHLAALVAALAADYSKQNPFYRRMREIAKGPDPLDRVPSLPGARTAEQRIAGELAHSAYSRYTSEMLARDERSQFHIDITNRWAHAMKTPVSVIDLLVQQSRETESSEEICALFESIQEENERIAHGLDMMLGMARQERFSVDLLPQRVDLAELAREAINKHRKWIAFVIDQLLSNAIKYTRVAPSDDDRKLLIRIDDKIKAEADAGSGVGVDAVTLTVEDCGVGIPEHDFPRIFDPFFTGENGRLAPESTGMGLFLANRICSELGHSLTVRSERGLGTGMTITFSTRAITSGVTVK